MLPPPEDVLLLLAHPFGDTWTTLADWIESGPGHRPLLRPVKARSRLTGEDLPLSVVPLQYRNDGAARLAIERGELKDPWADRSSR
jgi:hypothetical protein